MTLTETVTRDIPLPLYAQVEDLLTERLRSEYWKPGDQISTEAELCAAFGVSRTVVRQALDEMVHKGLLYRQRGKGTFVAREKLNETWVQGLSGFFEDMEARGLRPITQVLDQRTIPAPREVAAALKLPVGSDVVAIDRLRSVADSPPLLHVITHVPSYLCPGLVDDDLTAQSLYALLEQKYGLKVVTGTRQIEAREASEPEAGLLGIEVGSPILRIESVTYLADGRALEHFVAHHRGDRTRLEVEVVRTVPPTGSIR